MLSIRTVRGVIVLSGALLFTALLAAAKDGRDFAGFYSLTDVDEQDGQVRVTLNLQLFNYSDADIQGAVVVVREAAGVTEFGRFAAIRVWRNGHDVVLSRTLTVPRAEYERWSTRRQPGVCIAYTDHGGQEWTQTAQLNRVAAIPF